MPDAGCRRPTPPWRPWRRTTGPSRDRRKAREVGGAPRRMSLDRVCCRTFGRRTIRETPPLREALRARLGLEIVPVERPRQAKPFSREPAGRVLAREVVHQKASGTPIHLAAGECGDHTFT